MANGGGIARKGDMIEAICYGHATPIPVTGFFEDGGDTHNLTNGQPTIRLGDKAKCSCGHETVVVSASPNYVSSNIPVARMGDEVSVNDGPIGKIVTASGDSYNFNAPVPPRVVPPEITAVIPAEAISPDATFYDAVVETMIEDVGDPHSTEQGFSRTAEEITAIAYVGVTAPTSIPISIVDDGAVTANPPPPDPGSIVVGCENIPDDPPDTLRVSDNFNLSMLSSSAKISRYKIKDQTANGIFYSKKQVACNLSKLAANLLEPIMRQYPGFIVTSGFRHDSGKSNHNKGCAADIQWPSLNGANYVVGDTERAYFERITWIRDNLIWNELILEYGGNSGPWLHVSYKDYGTGDINNRTNFKTLRSLDKSEKRPYDMGVFKLYRNIPGVGGGSF